MLPDSSAIRMWDVRQGGGSLLDLGIYPLAFVSQTYGGQLPNRIDARGKTTTVSEGGGGVDKFVSAYLEYPCGGTAGVTTGLTASTPEEWVVTGSHGRIRVHGLAHTPSSFTLTTWDPEKDDPRGPDVKHQQMDFDDEEVSAHVGFNFPGSEGLVYEARAVEECILSGQNESSIMPMQESETIARIMDECRRQVGVVYEADATGPLEQTAMADVIVAGVGCPGRGMGWCHTRQLLDGMVTNGRPVAVVEPWFLSPENSRSTMDGMAEFQTFANELRENNIEVVSSFADLQSTVDTSTYALISARTHDNPALLKAAVDAGIRNILLEKPGAATIAELESIQQLADEHELAIALGFNRHVAHFALAVRDAMGHVAGDNCHVTYTATNTFHPSELEECFSRNAEGIAKNMMIHELALAVDMHGCTVEKIRDIDIIRDQTELLTLGGYEDFKSLTVRLHMDATAPLGSITIGAHRCAEQNEVIGCVHAGNDLVAKVNYHPGSISDDVAKRMASYPEMHSYFPTQWNDYIKIKTVMGDYVTSNGRISGSVPGLASVQTAIEAMRLAEFITQSAVEDCLN